MEVGDIYYHKQTFKNKNKIFIHERIEILNEFLSNKLVHTTTISSTSDNDDVLCNEGSESKWVIVNSRLITPSEYKDALKLVFRITRFEWNLQKKMSW